MATNLKSNNLNLNYYESFVTYEKSLDSRKLKLLLNSLGLNPVAIGTLYIIEELEYLYNSRITSIRNLEQAYSISAKLHKIDIKNVQCNIKYAITSINKFANLELFNEIFYWYDNYKSITPKFFMNTMLDYLYENSDSYEMSNTVK